MKGRVRFRYSRHTTAAGVGTGRQFRRGAADRLPPAVGVFGAVPAAWRQRPTSTLE